MDNDSKILDSWAMPDDLSKKIGEVLNNTPFSPEDELAKALGEMARDIALIEPDPLDWGGWIEILMEKMEVEADERRLISNYEHSLEIFADKIQNRIKGGKW